jgi:L-ascorbate metabolism protein UlaG (beta-lactamase superfamily)
VKITMVGHSTVVIETAGVRTLTDPWFGTWGNPAFTRLRPPARTREALLDVDLVLLSHNHWDHRDDSFFRALPATTPVFVPGRSAWVSRLHGVRAAQGLRPWEARRFGPLTITAVPAVHMATTIGFVVASPECRVYFSGDTYYGSWMARVGDELRPDIALMPVTSFRIPMTMREEGAVKAVIALKSRVVIPIHRGVQPRLPTMRTKDSAESFARRVREAGLAAEVVILDPGDVWDAPRLSARPDGPPASDEGRMPSPVAG